MSLEIETKEDSAEKLAAMQGKPTKYYLFANEFNMIVNKINYLFSLGYPTLQQVTDQANGNVTNNEITAAAFKTTNGEELSTKEWVENNNFAYRDELFEYINKLHFRKFVYDFLEPVGSTRLQLPQQESFLVINSNIDKITGFYIEEFESYNGKDYYIFNNTSQDVKLVNLDQNAEFDFNFKRGSNIIVPRKGIIHIKFIDGRFIDVNKSWIDFHELQSLNINNTNGGEVLTYNSSTQLWENKKVYNDLQIRRNGITISDDMIATTASDNFQKLTFNSGGWSVSTFSNENNPGVIAITSSVASASSGGSIIPSSSASPRNYAVGVGMQFDLIMRTSALSANVIMRFGIIAGTTNATQPSDGVYLRLNNNDLVGQTANASFRSQTSAYTGIAATTWYHFRVKLVSASLSVYELYDMDGTLLWTDSLTTNLPNIGEGVQPTFIAYNQIAEARQMCQVDYMSFTYPPMNRGALI